MSNTGNKEPVEVLHRLTTMLLDHLIMSVVVMLFFIPAALNIEPGTDIEPGQIGAGGLGWLQLAAFALYFCKDIINGRSLAKRMLKLQLVDNHTGAPADPVRTVVRNFFCFIWPVEVIVAMVNPARRIGDVVAGTRLEKFTPQPDEQSEPSYLRMAIAVAAAFVFVLVLAWGVNALLR